MGEEQGKVILQQFLELLAISSWPPFLLDLKIFLSLCNTESLPLFRSGFIAIVAQQEGPNFTTD